MVKGVWRPDSIYGIRCCHTPSYCSTKRGLNRLLSVSSWAHELGEREELTHLSTFWCVDSVCCSGIYTWEYEDKAVWILVSVYGMSWYHEF